MCHQRTSQACALALTHRPLICLDSEERIRRLCKLVIGDDLRVVRSTVNGWPLTRPSTLTLAVLVSSLTMSEVVRPLVPPPFVYMYTERSDNTGSHICNHPHQTLPFQVWHSDLQWQGSVCMWTQQSHVNSTSQAIWS